MKRFTLSLLMTAVLGLAAYTLSGAQGPGSGPDRRPGAGRPGFGRGPSVLRGIELTPEQRTQIDAIRQAERGDRMQQAGPPADVQLQRQLESEVFADTPDAQKIAALVQQISQAQADRLERQIALEQKIAQVLTAEQRARVRERLAQTPPSRGGRGPRGARVIEQREHVTGRS